MLVQAIIIAASAAFASAQVVYNQTTGQFICPANLPNGDFCAGDSLSTNIIIRCTNGIGQPGNCNDNLDGYPPQGLTYSPCWQTSNSSGDAACSKNCQVICGSGGCGNGTFTLPSCIPTYTASSSTISSTSSSISSPPTTTSSSAPTNTTGSTTTTSTGTTTFTTGSTTITETFTTTFCPSSTLKTSIVTGTGSSSIPSNGTVTTATSGAKTPTGPTTTASTSASFTGAANAYSPAVGGSLAGIGLIVAYFL